VLDLVARPLSPQALLHLLERKPDLLRPLAAQVLPPPLAATDPAERLGIDLSSLRTVEDFRQVLAATDPAERLGIDLSSLRTVEDFRQVLAAVMTAVARGQIAPAEAARVARRVRARSRALRRCARLTRPLARKASLAQTPPPKDARV